MGSNAANPDANMEPDHCHAPNGADEAPTFYTPVCITFYHRRKRLVDPDGLSGKAAIDGLVAAGILADDSPERVAEIRHRQSQGEPEETRIVIETVEE